MIDYEWYASFIAIYKHRSISLAAQARMMTQPAVSQHLAGLEARLGFKLFTRTTRKIEPTQNGKALYSYVAPLIEGLDKITKELDNSLAVDGDELDLVRIGTHHEFYTSFMAHDLIFYASRTAIYFDTADSLLDRLQHNQLDLIITSVQTPAPGVEYEALMDETFVMIAPVETVMPYDIGAGESSETLGIGEKHSVNEINNSNVADMQNESGQPGDDVREEWLVQQDWISYGEELPVIRRVWRKHFDKRPMIAPKYVIPDHHLILQAVALGTGFGIVPSYILDDAKNSLDGGLEELGVKIIFPEYSVQNTMYIAYKVNHKKLRGVRQVAQIITRDVGNKQKVQAKKKRPLVLMRAYVRRLDSMVADYGYEQYKQYRAKKKRKMQK
jgi:DNA-binding transcriptional LysR family regulator